MSAMVVPDEVNFAELTRETDRAASDAAERAEQAVLGGCLLDNLAWRLVPARFRDKLASARHRFICRAIGELIDSGRPADVVTVFEKLESWGQADAIGLPYLGQLQESVPTAANVAHYAQIVVERFEAEAQQRKQADASRLVLSGQYDEARALIDQIATQSVPALKRYPLLSVADLHGMPPLTWRIHGIFPTVGIAAIFGPKGSAKSFLALSMLAAIAEGDEWFGYRVRRGRSLYVGLEAPAGIRLRVKAWERANDRPFPGGVCFQFLPFNLTNRDDVLALAAAIDAAGGVDVIVIDTLNRASSTVDENSSEGMGQILDGATALQAMTGSLVVLVHHTGKDASKGMRGHSSLIGALDGAIEAAREGGRREWKVDKVKDGEDGAVHEFRIMPIDLGYDDEGEPLTSCVVMPPYIDDDTPAGPRARLPKGGNQKIIYDALGPLLRASGIRGRAGAPAIRPCITLDDAIEGTKERLAVDPRRRGERARQAITSLAASGVVGLNEGWLWLI